MHFRDQKTEDQRGGGNHSRAEGPQAVTLAKVFTFEQALLSFQSQKNRGRRILTHCVSKKLFALVFQLEGI